jgi:Fe-Mn family superoxide dismutase
MNRREVLVALGAAPAAAAAAADAGLEPPTARSLKPLPFKPGKLKGLSEKLLVSHHQNNYGGALKNLIKVEGELSRVTRDTPGFAVHGLKERELTFRNSVTLHEAYFASLGGDGKVPAALARYEAPLRSCALSLAGGSGWAVLAVQLDSGEVSVAWGGHHTQTLAGAVPLLVLDLYEHAYALDYGAATARYVDAFMANVKWDEVQRRHELALSAAALIAARPYTP